MDGVGSNRAADSQPETQMTAATDTLMIHHLPGHYVKLVKNGETVGRANAINDGTWQVMASFSIRAQWLTVATEDEAYSMIETASEAF